MEAPRYIFSGRNNVAVAAIFTLITLSFGGAAIGSDDDERLPYMIYIDPVTGKYTTENPSRAIASEQANHNEASGNNKRYSVAGVLLLMVLLILVYRAKTHK